MFTQEIEAYGFDHLYLDHECSLLRGLILGQNSFSVPPGFQWLSKSDRFAIFIKFNDLYNPMQIADLNFEHVIYWVKVS